MASWKRPRLWPPGFLFYPLFFAAASRADDGAISETAPALYTGKFGDCLGGQSMFRPTRFDVAYDARNTTVIVQIDGSSDITDENLKLHLSIDAYGENRFDMAFDPCNYNMTRFCPLPPGLTPMIGAVLPARDQPLAAMRNAFLKAPDFEGSARLRIYSASDKTEIGCFQAAMTNGRTLSHPEAIAPVLGGMALLAILASFATAAYGVSVRHMRNHHAHSLPALVVFEAFQAIFFSGALSVQWSAILVSWWSNFAWAAGLIYIPGMVRAIDRFTGVTDKASRVGDVGSMIVGAGEGSISGILARATLEDGTGSKALNSSYLYDYRWSGRPVAAGLPLPATYLGFPATLSAVNIPITDAFLVALIWLAVAVGLVVLSVVGFKLSLEMFARKDRFPYFRSHWAGYLGLALLRTLVIAFFLLMTLAMYQFTIRVTLGPVAIATVVFILAFIGIVSLIAYGCRVRTRGGKVNTSPDRIIVYRTTMLGRLPGVGMIRESTLNELELEVRPLCSIPLLRIQHVNTDPDRKTVHVDESFVKRFGWLSARYRRTRWWYLAYYVAYLFCRAAFIGGGWQNPPAQVYGLLAVDIVGFVIGIVINPFEGDRNTAMGVWILSTCKIATTAISIPFLPEFALDRTTASILGLVIIIIQGLTVAALLILIALSAVSSWMSMTRNMGDFDPDWFDPVRVAYFEHLEKKAEDAYEPWKKNGIKRKFEEKPPTPPSPYFAVNSVRRSAKIEDEDSDVENELDETQPDDTNSDTDRGRGRQSRASSVKSRYSTGSLPRAARPYRVSWSRDVGDPTPRRSTSVMSQRLSGISSTPAADGGGDTPNASSTGQQLRPQSSIWTLDTSPTTRSSTPSLRQSREILVNGEARRPPTALPEAPEPQEEE